MSWLEKYLAGWSFRTATPTFEPGQELAVIITGFDGDTALARVGDTVLHVEEAPAAALDARVRIEILEFDENEFVGRATFLDLLGEGTF